MYERHGEKLRFLVTGVFNTVFGYVLFLVTLALVVWAFDSAHDSGMSIWRGVRENYYLIAQWSAWVLSVPVGTWTMKRFAFRSDGRYFHEVARAYFVYLPAVGVNSAILVFTVRYLGLPPAAGQLFAIAASVMLSYVGHKYFTFGARRQILDVQETSAERDVT